MAAFVDDLSGVELSEKACNQYGHGSRSNAIRRGNLRLYLSGIGRPRMVLVGEAPSHRGGRLTGIPFTSETIMMRLLGAWRGYRKATPGARLSTEASATIVWSVICGIEPLPLLWNAFPFHPFAPGNPFSNRVPSADELRIGSPFLEHLLQLFSIEQVIAVGRLAERSLGRLGIPHHAVRHPSQGGKRRFVEGLLRLTQEPRFRG